MSKWIKKCTVGEDFHPTDGCVADVADSVRQGADLRRFSTYDPESTGLVEETMSLQTTWVFDEENVGGLSTLRHPVDCGLDFLSRPTMAYWIFNVTAPSSSVMLPLDGSPADDATGDWVRVDNTPFARGSDRAWLSKHYHWWVRDDWEEVCLNTHILTLGLGTLYGGRSTQHTTRPTLRDGQFLTHVSDPLPTTRRAQKFPQDTPLRIEMSRA